MVINGIKQIADDGGRYIVLLDYGSEGLQVVSQHEEIEQALEFVSKGSTHGNSFAIVELACFNIQEIETV